MRTVMIEAVAHGVTPSEAYERLADFPSYPLHAASVQRVTIDEQGDGWLVSTWEATLRNGLMRWTERDLFLREMGRIEFDQIEGDLDVFSGSWTVTAAEGGTRVKFVLTFDLGLPSLSGFLEPVAAQAIDENMRTLMRGLLDDVQFAGQSSEEHV